MKHVDIYRRLKQLRKERGLTLENLAKKIGSDYQQISRIERGKSKLTVDVLIKMAEALDTPVSDIVEAKHESSKLIPLEDQHSSSSVAQSLLTLILEKMEVLWQASNFKIHPQTKASLISQVYNQTLSLYQKTNNPDSIPEMIQFSMDIIKTTLADFDNEIVKNYQKIHDAMSEDMQSM